MCLWEFFFGRPPAKMYWMEDYVATEKDFESSEALKHGFTPAQLVILWKLFPARHVSHPEEIALRCVEAVKDAKTYKDYRHSRIISGGLIDDPYEAFYKCLFDTYYN